MPLLAALALTATPVAFRLHAPEARAVSLVGEMNGWDPKATPLTRGPDGTWSVTVPLEPGQWLYKLWADGQWLADPANPLSSPDGRGGRHSWVLVGDGDFRRHEGTPHGRIDFVKVPSQALGAEVELALYLPPGPPAPRPTLVLLHGASVDCRQWVDNGLIADFMDNLLQQGRLQPFLVAMPSVMPFARHPGLSAFLAEELPAWLQAHHQARPERAARALGGFSMGGGLTFQVAVERPQGYGLWLPLAPFVPEEKVGPWMQAAAHAGPIVMACGQDDGLAPLDRRLAQALKQAGAQVEYRELPGAHSFRFLNAVTPDLLERASRAFPEGPGAVVRHRENGPEGFDKRQTNR